MAEIQKDTNKVTRKEPKETKKENKPDKEKWNNSLGGTWVDITRIEFVNKP